RVRFVGVIDAPVPAARRYATEQRLSHLVLADPERRLIRRLDARHGGYIALIAPSGVVDGFWPACTPATLQDLARRIARLAGLQDRPLDVTGMPRPLITGCPFES